MQLHLGRIALVVHGGAGASKESEDGCVAAAEKGWARLRDGADALSAAIEAVVALEDDPRFNAGSGSILRSDGLTVETDAAVMDTRGRLGAVACLQRVRNPVLVARAVADTGHWLLAGDGALRFAREQGFADYDLAAHARKPKPGARETDTVGAVALDQDGHFAVAASTGGASPALPGRVGDTPIVGCGYYAGPAGAIAATGLGEHIVARMLARTVYDWIAAGIPLQQALNRGVALFPDAIDVGLIGLTRDSAAVASNRPMPAHRLSERRPR